jgi:superfamily II DNA/RNA helicase
MQLGEGPIALVLAPTRELAAQIHAELKKFATKVGEVGLITLCGVRLRFRLRFRLRLRCVG